MRAPLTNFSYFYVAIGVGIISFCWFFGDPATAKFVGISWLAVGIALALLTFGIRKKRESAVAHFIYLTGYAWLALLFMMGAFKIWQTGSVMHPTLAERLEAIVPQDFSGQIVISSGEKVLYSGNFGYADREAKVAVSSDTLFDIGSITKTYTATAVLLLAAQGKLQIDTTLSQWFDSLPEKTASITLHQLLSHTSGLPQYSGDDDEACDRDCFDTWLSNAELEFAPGEKYRYSNPGYSALARIIEKASGQAYEDFIVDALTGPIGAGPIGYLRVPESATYAAGYQDGVRRGIPPEMGWMEDGPPWHLRGNGGLLTTASGLQRWLQATAAGNVLPAEWRDRQFGRHAERGDGIWYGYGWVILDRPWGVEIDHTGGNDIFFADARWFRDKNLLLAITNNEFDREQIRALLTGIRAELGLVAE